MAMHAAIASAFENSAPMPLEQRHDPEVRKDLSRHALPVFFNVGAAWGLGVQEQRIMLGGIPASTFHKWKSGGIGALSYDQLERVSLVLGVFKALRLLFANDAQGVAWMKAKNSAVTFGGQAPLERMLQGGIDDLYAVRRYLDAWRGVK
jgi:hypothetical protein